MLLKLRLDSETAGRLCDMAVRELRTADAQAIALLRMGLGLSMPLPPMSDERDQAVREVAGV